MNKNLQASALSFKQEITYFGKSILQLQSIVSRLNWNAVETLQSSSFFIFAIYFDSNLSSLNVI